MILFSTYAFAYADSTKNLLQSEEVSFSNQPISTTIYAFAAGKCFVRKLLPTYAFNERRISIIARKSNYFSTIEIGDIYNYKIKAAVEKSTFVKCSGWN